MPTLETIATEQGYELRHHTVPLAVDESVELVVSPFEFSTKHGGLAGSLQYYNNYYLYPKK